LSKLIKAWNNNDCGQLTKIGNVTKKTIEWVMAEADYWAKKPAPEKPDNADLFELPQISFPAIPKFDINLDWLWGIFNNLYGDERRI
jgi:hypothetical protein